MGSARRSVRWYGKALCVLVLSTGYSWSDNPEKTENTAQSPETAGVQTKQSLEAKAAEVERRLAPLRDAVRREPDNPSFHAALGQAAVKAYVYDEGVRHLERAVELDPSVSRLLDLAIGYSFAARLDEAVGIYEQILRVAPDDDVALHNLGNLALRRKQYGKAIDFFNRALAVRPKYLLAQLHLADALKESGKPREAYRAYEKVLSLEIKTPLEAHGYASALYGLASLDLMMGAHERAGMFLQELIQISPQHEKAYYAYGQVLMHLGLPEEAQKAFDRHLQIQSAKPTTSAAAMNE